MIKIWDKKENINGVSAEDYINNNPLSNGDMLLLCNDNTGAIEQVLNVDIIRGNLKLDGSMSALEVGAEYVKSLESPQISDDTIQRINDLESALIELASMLGGNK